jgi:hypothetical protein
VEQLDRIDAEAVRAVAGDMAEDARQVEERVLPLRSVSSGASLPPTLIASPREQALEQRIAKLEGQIEEQEAALRRVLALLVDWVERDGEPLSYRHNAA